MHDPVAVIAPGSVDLWQFYFDNDEVPVPSAARLVLLIASPGTKAIRAQSYMQSRKAKIEVTGPNNQNAFYTLTKDEANALAPEERLALIETVRCIGKATSVGVFRKALGI